MAINDVLPKLREQRGLEGCVPFMIEKTGMIRDEAVSLMGAVLLLAAFAC